MILDSIFLYGLLLVRHSVTLLKEVIEGPILYRYFGSKFRRGSNKQDHFINNYLTLPFDYLASVAFSPKLVLKWIQNNPHIQMPVSKLISNTRVIEL